MLRASNVPGRIWVQFRIEDDYMEKEIDLRRLVIKAFHITEVEEGGENKVAIDLLSTKVNDILTKHGK